MTTETNSTSLPPLYLFIIWHNAKKYEDAIMQDIKSHFDLFRTYRVDWSENYFAEELTRFYGKNLPKSCKKEKEIGIGDFTAVLVYDNKPDMIDGINRNTILAKGKYREQCHANLIHASDNVKETNENLLFLFGKTVEEIAREKACNDVIPYHHDCVGCPCWENEEEAFEIAKKIPFTEIRKHKNAVHISSAQTALIKRVLNAHKSLWPFGCKYFIKIQNKKYPLYIEPFSKKGR